MSRSGGAEERGFVEDEEGNLCRTAAYMTDAVSEDPDKVPLQTHPLREFEQHLNDLKKENFSLKLRIYFLEERIQQKFEEGSDDVHRTNIELKVEVESLKQELQEKQQQLEKAQRAAESVSDHNEAELQRRCDERREIDRMQHELETEIHALQEEARAEAERMAGLTECEEQHPSVAVETVPMETLGDEDADRERLCALLSCKQALVLTLSQERLELRQRLGTMEDQLQLLSSSLLQKERDAQFFEEELGRERLRVQQEMQTLMEAQHTQLQQYEDAAGQCVCELQTAQAQVEALQDKIQESETSNQKLQDKLCEMESELQSIRQSAQDQERTIANLTDSLRTKDTETQELYHVIESQNNTLCKLTENQQLQAPEGAVDAGSALALFSSQIELEEHQRAHTHTQRRLEDLQRSRDRLQDELQDALQHRDATHTHNQDLCAVLERLRSELQVKVCELRDREAETRSETSDRDKTIAQLQQSLRRRDALLQEYSELDVCESSGADRDALLQTLRSRIRDRDAALERSIDEKFLCLEEKEAEARRLRLELREKDRDLERLRCVLNNNTDTITGLDALVRSKDLDLERTQDLCRKLEWMKQQSDEKHTLAVCERDGLIQQLQAAVHTHTREAEELRSLCSAQLSSSDVLQKLRADVCVKEQQCEQLMSERRRQTHTHQTQIEELLSAISSRDQEHKEYGERLGRVIRERSEQLTELRRELRASEEELQQLKRERERDAPDAGELQRLQQLLSEKHTLIQALLQGQSETSSSTAASQDVCTSSSGDSEIQAIRDELQLTLKKHRETERELSDLRSVLSVRGPDTMSSDQQCVLQQLVSEQQALNEALRVEKDLYQNLRRTQSPSDSAVHSLLDAAQALRGQLDEALARVRRWALAVDRAALIRDDYGESSSDEDEDEAHGSSSEEFTDSIEDDDTKPTARSLRSAQEPLVSRSASRDERRDEEETLLHASPRRSAGVSPGPGSGPGAHPEASARVRGSEKRETERGDSQEEEEEEYEDEDEDEDVRAAGGKRGPPCVRLREQRRKRRCTRPHSLDLGALLAHQHQDVEMEREVEGDSGGSSAGGGGASGFWQHVEAGLREQAERLRGDLAVSRQESRDLQERLMVSEATVHAQAEQIKDYRELLTESAVQRVSKQVQVDLQDLGYETSGRSENEAERDDASSPEFEELEVCVSLSGSRLWSGGTEAEDPCALKRLVQDLRAQLSRCHRVIRGLQLRLRSLTSTSDYSSSLERAPRKQVNWALEAPDEDEGWLSDGRGRELQELGTRVALLETQIRSSRPEGKSAADEGKCATWPGKYNTLIQAQARELSHLRQKMREGRGICHILTQHLSDTTKAFEELLRANDIDYYTSQSFRQQLSQSTALALRVSSKISGRDRSEQQDDKTGHELLALRLSKELQHKDQIIESLHTQLQQRPDTPLSSHAPSDTSDQSDCTSFLSDERGSTNEEADLCSDVDAASEFAQEDTDTRAKSRGVSTGLIQTRCDPMTSDPPPRPHCRPPMRTFSAPHSLSSYQLTNHTPPSHHALGASGPSVPTDALWDVENRMQPIRGFDGSPYYPSCSSQSGVDVIEEHLREIRSLRQRLEESIRTNERLRQQLQGRLRPAARDTVAPTNIFIQSHDAVGQLTNEVRALKEENLTLQSRLQASRDSREEAEQLREAVLSGRVRLQQAELEAEQWKEELRRLQTHTCEQSQQIQQLRQDRQSSQEQNIRLQHEASLLQQQLTESRSLLNSLQNELMLQERSRTRAAAGFVCERRCAALDLAELLVELRALRAQLERSVQENGALRAQLQKHMDLCGDQRPSPIVPASPLRDALYRRTLLHDPSPSPPVRDVGPFPTGPLYSPYSELEESTNDALEPPADVAFAPRLGRVCEDGGLQQQVLEGRELARRVEESLSAALLDISGGKAVDGAGLKTLLCDSRTLRQILDEAASLLKMLMADGPALVLHREQSLREEIQALRVRTAEQEELLQETIRRLRRASRTKESMESFIASQLTRTRDVLKKARANLEKNELRISSLSSSSSSLCHAQVSRGSAGPSAWGRVTSATPGIAMETAGLQQPSRKRVRECVQLTASH